MKLKKGDVCLIYVSYYSEFLIGIFDQYVDDEWARFDMNMPPKMWIVREDNYVKIGVL